MPTRISTLGVVMLAVGLAPSTQATAANPFDSWRQDRPGIERRISPRDVPPPKRGTDKEAPDLNNHPKLVRRPGANPKAPPGFAVQLYASGLKQPRNIRVAPNGDIFVAESGLGRILLFRGGPGAPSHVFASGLRRPFGIAFYPLGPKPQWVYVGETDKIVRFPYRSGALAATGPKQVIVPHVPSTHHWTRDVTVAADGRSLFYSVGSGSNVGGDMAALPPGGIAAFARAHPLGQGWGGELGRAEVRQFDPDGRSVRTYATGLRNCVSMSVQPGSGALWCVVNERDGLGDNTPPEYATRVRQGAFYGWPWYYIGDHPDPRLGGRADLRGKVTVPDVLMQAHTAPLGLTFYNGGQFPADYRGDAFVAMHGSWDRTVRDGYKVVRLRFSAGRPTGIAEDFLTGFVVDDHSVGGRPVGVAVGRDGALLVSDDGSGSIWRVTWAGSTGRR
jgi:glucose/arabinose dehydrogenase